LNPLIDRSKPTAPSQHVTTERPKLRPFTTRSQQQQQKTKNKNEQKNHCHRIDHVLCGCAMWVPATSGGWLPLRSDGDKSRARCDSLGQCNDDEILAAAWGPTDKHDHDRCQSDEPCKPILCLRPPTLATGCLSRTLRPCRRPYPPRSRSHRLPPSMSEPSRGRYPLHHRLRPCEAATRRTATCEVGLRRAGREEN
jgi:hypothetical protein